jgi:DNA-binding NarL/FixJ family response regulator
MRNMDRLLGAAAEFLADGLRSGEPGLVFATRDEYTLISARLRDGSIDVDEAERSGCLVFVDGPQVLTAIIVNRKVDAERLNAHVGQAIDAARQACSGRLARVYSGMVAALAASGETATALQLEQLLFGLARTYAFSLLCAHAMAASQRQGVADTGKRPPSKDDAQTRTDPRITNREGDVLRRTALGHANKDIAAAMNISVRTVEAHKANAMRKLGLAERADVVRFAATQGWLSDLDDPTR